MVVLMEEWNTVQAEAQFLDTKFCEHAKLAVGTLVLARVRVCQCAWSV